MKIKVKAPFFDENGIHKIGEICEVSRFNPERMEPVEEKEKAEKPIPEEITEEIIEEKKEKIEKAVRNDSKKNTRKKV